MADRPVLLVDSDDAAAAARAYAPPTWAVAVADPHADISQHSHAIIWGRNDEGGRTWAESVAAAAMIPVHVIALPRLPKHWGLADPLPDDRTPAQVTRYLQTAVGRCILRLPASVPVVQPAPPPETPPPAPQRQAVVTTSTHDIIDLPFIRSGSRGDGAVKPIMHNAALLLAANQHRWPLRLNEFSARVTVAGEYLNDTHALQITNWCQECGVHASSGVIYEAINHVAGDNRFNPVKDYLDSLEWDDIPRLDMLFVDHAGTPDTPLTRAVTARWFIQAVARVYEPGCQADCTIVLEGDQGLRKSSLFRQLFGDKWFTDHLPDLTSKDALLQLRGVWCVEIAELATLNRADVKKINQFLTSRVDRYRDPYGRVVADFPRTCVFAGSVNPGAGGYLKDETGARRFWPVQVNERINTGAIVAVRDLLWAEAVARFKAGERWYLDTQELESHAADVASERFVSDPWQHKIDEFLVGRTQATVDEIFKVAVGIVDVGKWNPVDMNRVSRCLSFAGWSRRRVRGKWVYVPSRAADADADDAA